MTAEGYNIWASMSSDRSVVPAMLSGWIPRLMHSDNVGFSRKRTLALADAIALMCFAGAAAVPDVQLLSKPSTQDDLSRKIRRALGR